MNYSWHGSLGKATISSSLINQTHFYRNLYEGSYEGSNVRMNKNPNDDLNKNYDIFVSMVKC